MRHIHVIMKPMTILQSLFHVLWTTGILNDDNSFSLKRFHEYALIALNSIFGYFFISDLINFPALLLVILTLTALGLPCFNASFHSSLPIPNPRYCGNT